MKMRTDMK